MILKHILICIAVLQCIQCIMGQSSYEDKRCKCVCPSIKSVTNNTQDEDRYLIIDNVPPHKCNCVGVILPRIGDKVRIKYSHKIGETLWNFDIFNNFIVKIYKLMSQLILLQLKEKEKEFCPRCECVYENRNTTIIKVVVIIVIWVISLLACYMAFLSCLDPLLNKRVKSNYQEHTNEEEDATAEGAPGQSSGSANDSHQMNSLRGTGSNMLNRVGHQQDKWKRQVREQRRNIYDRHTMLN